MSNLFNLRVCRLMRITCCLGESVFEDPKRSKFWSKIVSQASDREDAQLMLVIMSEYPRGCRRWKEVRAYLSGYPRDAEL